MIKRRPAPTISDVARRAGVSAAAVSRVMSGDASFVVRDETRQRITDAVRALDYRPNQMARGLRSSRTLSLGIVVPELENPVHARIIIGAERAAAAHGYSLLIAHRNIDAREAVIYERLVQYNRVDGLIVATLQDEQVAVSTLDRLGAPFVLVNRKAKGVRNYVVVDDRGGARKAVDYLVGLGHRRIAHLSGAPHRYNSQCRLQGYRDGLEAAGLAFEPCLVAEAGYTQLGGVAAMRRILKAGEARPTAIFATTLLVAAGAMRVLRDEGIAVPEDMSIVGFHDNPIAEILAPPLTTVRVPLEDMAYRATTTLIGHVEGKGDMIGDVLPDSEIIVRASTSFPPRTSRDAGVTT